MTTPLTKVTTMTYPNYCPYCSKKYSSLKCVLPYALVSELTLPTDQTDLAIELTELHCSFKTELLRENAEKTQWHLSHSDPSHGSVFSPTHNWVVHNDNLPPSRLTSTVASNSISGVLITEDHSSPPETEFQHLKTLKAAKPRVITAETHNDTVSKTDSASVPQTRSPLTAANLEQLNSSPTVVDEKFSLTTVDALHLANDLVLALVTAQNLRKKNRSKLSLSELHSTTEKELETADHLGPAYKPHSSTPLDHPIALAREIIAHHDTDTVNNWMDPDTKLSTKHSHCICSFKRLSPTHDSSTKDVKLDNALLHFAKSSLTLLMQDKSTKKHSTKALKSLLAERSMLSSLEWLTNSPLDKLYLNDQKFLHQEKLLSSLNSTEPAPKLKLKESVPPVSDKVASLLKDKLPTVISMTLAPDSSSPLKQVNSNFLNTANLSLLSEHIVRYNPHWTTPTFCVTTHIIENALRANSMTASAYENLLLTLGMTDILNNLRDSQTQN